MQPYFQKVEMEMIGWRIGTYINFQSNDAYLKAEFDKWDDNKNGVLEREEVKKMMGGLFNQNVGSAMGQGGVSGANQQALDYLFARFNESGGNGFTFQEFKKVAYYSLKTLAKKQLMERFGTNDFTSLLSRYKAFVLNFFTYCSPDYIYSLLEQTMNPLTDEQKYYKIEELVSYGYSNAGQNALADYCYMYSIVAITSPDWITECFDIGTCFQKIWGLPEIIDGTIASLQGD